MMSSLILLMTWSRRGSSALPSNSEALVCLCQIISQRVLAQILEKEFKQFLNIARRSTFENANILILLHKRSLITQEVLNKHLIQLRSALPTNHQFSKSLGLGGLMAIRLLFREKQQEEHGV